MTALAKTDADTWNDYTALQRAVDRVGDGLTDALVYLDRVSRLMPMETFPERRLSRLLDRVDALATDLRRGLKDVARRRGEAEEARACIEALFADAAE